MGVADTPLTRRGLLRGVAALVAARGVCGALDGLVTPARAEAATVTRLQEHYLIDRLEAILDNGVPVVVPPIYNDVFTAKLAGGFPSAGLMHLIPAQRPASIFGHWSFPRPWISRKRGVRGRLWFWLKEEVS